MATPYNKHRQKRRDGKNIKNTRDQNRGHRRDV